MMHFKPSLGVTCSTVLHSSNARWLENNSHHQGKASWDLRVLAEEILLPFHDQSSSVYLNYGQRIKDFPKILL